ncbi:MAG: alpha/beta hydrolase [Rhodocyclaceae bacterium]|nr:alpha/beta hydrolase [Rhodocyclaceae bacterium]
MLRRLLRILLVIVLVTVGGLIAFLYLAPETFTRLAVAAERSRAGLVRKEIVLPDGLRYAYLEGGQGEPLLLLHGFGANKDNFIRIAPYLTARYRLIVPDHIGFAESSHNAQAGYGPDIQAERLHALLLALGIRGKVHVGGNSMGGLIALHYGLHYPQDTASLWLLDPAGATSAPPTEFLKAVAAGPKNPLLVGSTEDLAYLLSQAASKPPFIPRPMLAVFAQERIANQALEKKILADLFKDRTEQRIAGMALPTLIVWGDEDRLLAPAGAEILHRLLPNSQVAMMPDIGHMPMIEDPAATAADFLRFASGLNSGLKDAPAAGTP